MAAGAGLAVEDALYHQARCVPARSRLETWRAGDLHFWSRVVTCRSVHGQEFEEWASSVRKTLELNDRGSNCLTLLRQLFVLTAVTKYPRK